MMFSRIVNGLSNPALATRYIGRKSLDKLFNAFPAFEEFTRLQLMDRRLPKSLNAARKVGLPSNVVFDIGARHGYWSEYMSRHIKAEFILFEANEEHAPQLKDRGFRSLQGSSRTERETFRGLARGRQAIPITKRIHQSMIMLSL